MDCKDSKSLITAYVDEQLEPAEQADLQQHLARCHRCRSASEAEEGFRDIIREVYAAEKAPTRLRANIRKRLAVGENRFGFLSGILTRPRLIAAMALTILVASIVGVQIYKNGLKLSGAGIVRVSDLYGSVECIGCYYAETSNLQNYCEDFGHSLALLTDTRDVYSFMPNEKSVEILPDLMHTEVKITGWVFYQANFIEIEKYEFAEPSVAMLDLAMMPSIP